MWLKSLRCATCQASSRCCRSSRAPLIPRPCRAPRPPACGNSCRPPASILNSDKTLFAMTGVTCWPRPGQPWTTCKNSMACLATGIWRWPPTTGVKAACAAPSTRTSRRAWERATPISTCRWRRACTSPSCRPSKTLWPIRARSNRACPISATTPSFRPWTFSATSTWRLRPSWPRFHSTISRRSTRRPAGRSFWRPAPPKYCCPGTTRPSFSAISKPTAVRVWPVGRSGSPPQP